MSGLDQDEMDKRKVEWAQFYIGKGLNVMEKAVEEHTGPYCFGDLTLADIFMVPQVYNAVEVYGLQLHEYPRLAHVYKELLKMPQFRATAPEQQPGYPL